MKKIFLLLTIFTAISLSAAQFKIVSDVKELAGDITAQKYGQKDVNGQWCAIVKVHSDIEGILFEGMGYEKHDYKGEGIYLVYMQPESKTLKFKKEDFVAYNHTFPFRLKSNTVYQMEVVSEGEEKKIEDITINIVGKPEGANVVFDGQDKAIVKQIETSVGKHELKLSKEGYLTQTKMINVSADSTMFEYKLEKLEDTIIDINSNPVGATVFIDGIKIGDTPITDFYSVGDYKIRLECKNYESLEDGIEIRSPETKKTYQMTFIGATLTINTHEKAKVFINGEQILNLKDIKLLPQIANIKVELDGAKTLEKRIVLGKKDIQTIDMFPEISTGIVQVAVIPLDAEVDLWVEGGISYSSIGNKIFTEVPVGDYKLKISKKGFKTQVQDIKLVKGMHEKKSVKLYAGEDESEFVKNEKTYNKSGMEFGLDWAQPYDWVDDSDYNLGGADVKVIYAINKKMDMTAKLGFLFRLDDRPDSSITDYKYFNCKQFSIMAGLRIKMPYGTYIMGEVGMSRLEFETIVDGPYDSTLAEIEYSATSLTYSFGLGYMIGRFDISAYYSSISLDTSSATPNEYPVKQYIETSSMSTNFQKIGLRLGYKFWIF